MPRKYEFHPVVHLLPAMSQEDYVALRDDIRKNGQHDPIELLEERIIDGKHRYLACQELKIEPFVVSVKPEGSLVAYVLSKNVKRRHLTPSQKAMLAARSAAAMQVEENIAKAKKYDPKVKVDWDLPLKAWEIEDRAESSRAGSDNSGRSRGTKAGVAPSSGRSTRLKAAPEAVKNETVAATAKLSGASVRSTERALKVLRKGTPELVKAVAEGEIPLTKAEDLAKKPPSKQTRDLVSAVSGTAHKKPKPKTLRCPDPNCPCRCYAD